MLSCLQELDELPNFKGIVSSFDSSTGEWERWYRQVRQALPPHLPPRWGT